MGRDQLLARVQRVLESSLGLSRDERFLVVSDLDTEEIAELFFRAGVALGAESARAIMTPRSRHGENAPGPVAAAMKAADVIVCPTTFSLTHTEAAREAAASGARIATMPGVTMEMLRAGAITADYARMAETTRALAALLTEGRRLRVQTGECVLELSLGERRGIASTGIIRERGQIANLPSGEAYIAPLEGSAEGELLADGSIAGIGLLKEPLRLTISEGRLVAAEGPEASRLLAMLDASPQGRVLAEFGIGTNEKARLTGIILEDEKILGTAHVAFGDNKGFGGANQAEVHVDAVFTGADVDIDGVPVMRRGQLVLLDSDGARYGRSPSDRKGAVPG